MYIKPLESFNLKYNVIILVYSMGTLHIPSLELFSFLTLDIIRYDTTFSVPKLDIIHVNDVEIMVRCFVRVHIYIKKNIYKCYATLVKLQNTKKKNSN